MTREGMVRLVGWRRRKPTYVIRMAIEVLLGLSGRRRWWSVRKVTD